MKSCDEMVNSLLERRDRYEAEKKRRRSILTRIATATCCVGFAALLGVGIWKSGIVKIPRQEPTPGISEKSVKYITMGMSADWPVYRNVTELTDAGNLILLGKIVDISFAFENPYLYTDYGIEVVTSYKGDAADTVNLRLMGGIEGTFIEEQKAALKEKADEGIPLVEKRPDLALGQTYLFVLYQYENAIPTLVNPDQGAFSIDDPLAKDVFSYVSAKEIISFFGEDKWGSFEAYKNALE